MSKLNCANLKKTIYYFKRNGIINTYYAVRERLKEQKAAPYCYVPVSEEEWEIQRAWAENAAANNAEAQGVCCDSYRPCLSIAVPVYRTKEIFMKELIDSVMEQSYPYWELVLADATEDDSVTRLVEGLLDAGVKSGEYERPERVRYVKLKENAGIAANTNQALQHTSGDYIGLLDHDDVLTKDALYEAAVRITEAHKQGRELLMLYSDEDKCNGDRTVFYEPHCKEDFNQDMLLSNNYICHFLVMKQEFMKELSFRPAYDGAQDYDLVLRAALALKNKEELICHIPKVLYHWRCHTGSTAENPQSKQYAYDAGLRALQSYADAAGYRAKAVHLKHLGFYRLEYPEGVLNSRPDLAAVGGKVIGRKKAVTGPVLIGGRMDLGGKVFYEGIPAAFSGYFHRAVLTQSAEAVDIRCIQVREECRTLFENITGVPYQETAEQIFDAAILPEGTDYKELSLKLCEAFQKAGYRILYDPSRTRFWKRTGLCAGSPRSAGDERRF